MVKQLNMRIADLYIRISTDENIDKGHSKTDQEKSLRRFCIIQSLRIGEVIYEEHSANTFRRPKWTRLMSDLRKRKRHADLILFTTWDRFSTNAENAYRMSTILRKLGTEPQAIDQPINLSVPVNKIMLAFYLDAFEIENRRRALNALFCMQRAKKKRGQMANIAPGHRNKTNQNKIKNSDKEKLGRSSSRWSIPDIIKPTHSTEEIWKELFYLVRDEFKVIKKQGRRALIKEDDKIFKDILVSCDKINNMISFLAKLEFAFFTGRMLACKLR